MSELAMCSTSVLPALFGERQKALGPLSLRKTVKIGSLGFMRLLVPTWDFEAGENPAAPPALTRSSLATWPGWVAPGGKPTRKTPPGRSPAALEVVPAASCAAVIQQLGRML